GPLVPLFRIRAVAQPAADLLHILFGLIQQAVEADGSVVVRRGAEGTKPKTYVESRLSHGAVALVVIRTQFELLHLLAIWTGNGACRVANLKSVRRTRHSLSHAGLVLQNVAICLCGMKEKISCYFAIEAGF